MIGFQDVFTGLIHRKIQLKVGKLIFCQKSRFFIYFRILVASLDDPTQRAVVVRGNLVNPRGIAVDPNQKYALFVNNFGIS